MEKTGIREPLNSPIPHPGPLDSAPGPAQTTRGILQNLPSSVMWCPGKLLKGVCRFSRNGRASAPR